MGLVESRDLPLPLAVLLTPAALLLTSRLLDLPRLAALEPSLPPFPELCGGTYTFVILIFFLLPVGISIDCASVLWSFRPLMFILSNELYGIVFRIPIIIPPPLPVS